jgi:hypothetical protein
MKKNIFVNTISLEMGNNRDVFFFFLFSSEKLFCNWKDSQIGLPRAGDSRPRPLMGSKMASQGIAHGFSPCMRTPSSDFQFTA